MNQSIRIFAPKTLRLHNIIQSKYTELYRQWKEKNTTSKSYPLSKLRQNIASAYSIVRKSFPYTSLKQSTYIPWYNKGWFELYHFHWYFAISLVKDNSGLVKGQIEDAHYEGDHHNDTLTSKPYDESIIKKRKILIKESDMRKIVRECIQNVLIEQYPNEIQFGRWKCVIGGDIYEINDKGVCQGIRMYMDMESKDKTTYCLFRRMDNRKYFYCTIVPAPEKGPKETKFLTVPLSKVPQMVLQDFYNPHL